MKLTGRMKDGTPAEIIVRHVLTSDRGIVSELSLNSASSFEVVVPDGSLAAVDARLKKEDEELAARGVDISTLCFSP